MTELKTLKDMKFELKEIPHAGWLVWYHDLRQEAIEHYKELIKNGEKEEIKWIEDLAKARWIKEFFNITDEELK